MFEQLEDFFRDRSLGQSVLLTGGFLAVLALIACIIPPLISWALDLLISPGVLRVGILAMSLTYFVLAIRFANTIDSAEDFQELTRFVQVILVSGLVAGLMIWCEWSLLNSTQIDSFLSYISFGALFLGVLTVLYHPRLFYVALAQYFWLRDFGVRRTAS